MSTRDSTGFTMPARPVSSRQFLTFEHSIPGDHKVEGGCSTEPNYAHEPRKEIEQFSKAIQLAPEKLKAYLYWHRAFPEQQLSTYPTAENHFTIAENCMRDAEKACSMTDLLLISGLLSTIVKQNAAQELLKKFAL